MKFIVRYACMRSTGDSLRSTSIYIDLSHWQIEGTVNFFFFKVFGGHMSFFGATGTPVLDFWWHILWVLKSEWVLPYSLFFAEANVMYIPWDPPLVLHMPTSWGPALLPVLHPHNVAEVRLPGFELILSEYLWVRRNSKLMFLSDLYLQKKIATLNNRTLAVIGIVNWVLDDIMANRNHFALTNTLNFSA